FGSTVERAERRIRDAAVSLEEVNLGGRAVGTGFNTMQEFSATAVRNLAHLTNLNLRAADDYFRLTQSMSDLTAFSSSLKELSIDLGKISADIRLMSSGPAAGFGEIKLPELIMQASALLPDAMPKTAVPPMTETLSMVAYQVMGNDQVVALAAQSGQLDSNSFMPLIIDNILTSMSMLEKTVEEFNRHCLSKITANAGHCKELLDKSGGLIAALASELGYQKALDVVMQAEAEGADVKDVLLNTKILPKQTLDKIFHYKFMTTPRSNQ
ncbi:MAG TPA: lyase family protein, partial [Blastocatellia bacterium]|nr:lyase family protein [Blastocatellia bacterium]